MSKAAEAEAAKQKAEQQARHNAQFDVFADDFGLGTNKGFNNQRSIRGF